ncbi:DUF3953 domain-containing protein [Bacillus sp. BGMRC 2118]|nr:DUF3953 domain-containing protein [Bacillus sp. BGMRC 2118]
MLQIPRYVLSVIVIGISAYGLITKDFRLNHIMILLLGLTMLIMGLEEFKKKQTAKGWLFVAAFLFSLVVSIQGFLI